LTKRELSADAASSFQNVIIISRIMDKSFKYPFVNDSCEDLLNSKHKHVKLMEELEKRDKISIAIDLTKLVLEPFCISPGCTIHSTAARDCKDLHNNR
jgi:hypothetical protein